MAAWPDSPPVDVVDLRTIRAGTLDEVLQEEARTWAECLHWDFTSSAALVKRFVDMQSLNGMAVVSGDRVVGYTYIVVEDDKGLIGDLYVMREFATPALEDRLLNETVQSLQRVAGLRRIESQVILLHHPRPSQLIFSNKLTLHERCFMVCDVRAAPRWPEGISAKLLDAECWSDRYQEDAAGLIADSYEGHIDSFINDQYRSVNGARRFLQNIIQYPGCGSFHPSASWLAWRRDTGRLCALSLASMVASNAGHITQICVTPGSRGEGIGREILSCSLRQLAADGCGHISLTVTSANKTAIRMYETMGFAARRRFAAMVWDQLRPAKRYFL